MADDRKDVGSQQSGSGSDQGASRKQGEQGRENQPGQQTPKKDPQSNERDQGTHKTGTH